VFLHVEIVAALLAGGPGYLKVGVFEHIINRKIIELLFLLGCPKVVISSRFGGFLGRRGLSWSFSASLAADLGEILGS
jgi:hypothetical protein